MKPSFLHINYKRHTKRISIDENHFYVTSMASSEYIYLLGDDDYFLPYQLGRLCEFISLEKPSLAVFSDVDPCTNHTYGATPSIKYLSVDTAFLSLWDKCKFGYILVQRRLLDDLSFKYLFDTAHAYGCFWISLFNMQQLDEDILIIQCNYAFVSSSTAPKNYDRFDVYYRAIPLYFHLIKNKLKSAKSTALLQTISDRFLARTYSLRYLVFLLRNNDDLIKIKKFNPKLHNAKFLLIRFIGLKLLNSCADIARRLRDLLHVFIFWNRH